MPYRDFHYRWEYELQSSPEQLWSFVADTNRFNRDAGVPALQPADGKRHRLRNARRRLRLSFLGVPVEWEEQPFEWIKPSRFGVVRKYSKGPIDELKVLAELSPLGDHGCKLIYQIWARPKSLLGFLLIPVQVGYASRRRFSSAFENYDKTALTEVPISAEQSSPELSSAVRSRLEAAREKLLLDGAVPRVVEKLIDFIERADDFSLARIRPYELADRWDEPRRAVLAACLLATRQGLLDMQWDLLCPLCRGPQESETSLSDISSKVHCETCRIDFTVNFDRFVEITFKPNASVRRAEVKDYCMGSPQRTPHVVVQQLLAPHTTRKLVLPLEVGSYRLRTLELPGEQLVTVGRGGRADCNGACVRPRFQRGVETSTSDNSAIRERQRRRTIIYSRTAAMERPGCYCGRSNRIANLSRFVLQRSASSRRANLGRHPYRALYRPAALHSALPGNRRRDRFRPRAKSFRRAEESNCGS